MSTLESLSKKDLINIIAKSNSRICIRCGNKSSVVLNATKDNIKVRKLCSLCNDCFIDLIDYLGVCDRLESE